MNIKKIIKWTGIIASGLIIVGGIVMGLTGLWPIARADGDFITYDLFEKNFVMADHFYRSNLKLAGESDSTIMSDEAQRDLQRVTMEGLIESILIDHELAKKYKENDLQQLIDNKIKNIDLETANMDKATELVYGLTPEQFKELILIPKAKQEILEGNLTLQNGTFNDWLTAKKSEARVSVFVPSLHWENNEVKVKQ